MKAAAVQQLPASLRELAGRAAGPGAWRRQQGAFRVELPRLELGQGVGLTPWCLRKAQLSTAFTDDSPASHHAGCSTAQRSQEVCCGEPGRRQHPERSSGCPAVPGHTAREGKGDPSCLRIALQLVPVSPSSEQAKQSWPYGAKSSTATHVSGQTAKPPQAPRDSPGLTQLPAAEMDRSSCPFPGLFCSFQLAALIVGSAGPGRRTASLASCA